MSWYWKLIKRVRLSDEPAISPQINWAPSYPSKGRPYVLQSDGKIDCYQGFYYWLGTANDFCRYNTDYTDFPIEGFFVYPEFTAFYGGWGWVGGWTNTSLFWQKQTTANQMDIRSRTSDGTEIVTSIYNSASVASSTKVIEISDTHYLVTFLLNPGYDNSQRWYIIDIGATVNRNTAPYFDVIPTYDIRSFKNYHDSMIWDDGTYEYSANVITHVITQLGIATIPVETTGLSYIIDYSHNTEHPDTWLTYRHTEDTTQNEQGYDIYKEYISNLDKSKTPGFILLETMYDIIAGTDGEWLWVDSGALEFSRFDSDGYPILFSDAGEVWKRVNGVYTSKNPIRRWDITNDDFVGPQFDLDGSASLSGVRFVWYTDTGKIYMIADDNSSTESYDWAIYQCIGIGTASVGKHTIAASKIDNKYGSIS